MTEAVFFLSNAIYYIYCKKFSGFAVIPVPCSRKSIKRRGWDHMLLIAELLKKKKVEVINILKRNYGKEQKKLASVERFENIGKKYYLNKKISIEKLSLFKGILIIDDIFTTGATVDECSKIIKNTGKNNNIHILTIALD